jgi:hypothetical protein
MAPDTICSTSADWSAGLPHIFSTKTTIEAVIKVKHLLTTCYNGLLGLWHQHAIGTFNTCSRGSTHRSLIIIGGGYNLVGAGLPHHTPRPSKLTVLCFPPKGPARSQVIQNLPKIPRFKFKESMFVTWSFNHSAIYRKLHLCLAIANDLSLALGFTRIVRKVT